MKTTFVSNQAARSEARAPTAGQRALRIVIADDQAAILDRVERLLAEQHEVVARVGDGAALVERVGVLQPDLAVVDLSMPGMNGIDATRQITASSSTRVVIFTIHKDPAWVDAAFHAGARGYVLKPAVYSELMTAVDTVAGGGLYLSSRLR